MKHIIFIEGVSGVGKSTAVNKLSEKLQNLGYSVESHLEGDAYSPLDLCWTAYLTIPEYENLLILYPEFAENISDNIIYRHADYILLRYQIERVPLYSSELNDELHKQEFCYNPANTAPISNFTEVFANLWRQFTQSYNTKHDFFIFDASLVSHMTNDLIRNYNASEAEMTEHIEKLLQIIHPMNPLIFYLSSDNVTERVINARINRGQTPLDEKKIEFWNKRKESDLSILPKLSVKPHTIDITNGDWNSAVSYIISQII